MQCQTSCKFATSKSPYTNQIYSKYYCEDKYTIDASDLPEPFNHLGRSVYGSNGITCTEPKGKYSSVLLVDKWLLYHLYIIFPVYVTWSTAIFSDFPSIRIAHFTEKLHISIFIMMVIFLIDNFRETRIPRTRDVHCWRHGCFF